MQTVLVINSKGGSGKTTLTTNLASYFAVQGHKTAIMDYDPQGSSLQWLKVRPESQPAIHGANAAPSKGDRLRSITMAVPADTQYLVIDAPAGVDGIVLQEMVRKTDLILIPVAPSSVDLHATQGFIRDLFLIANIKNRKIKTAIVANRLRSSMSNNPSLERFIHDLDLPCLSRLSDSDHFIHALELGLGIYEMDRQSTIKEREELRPVIDWLEGKIQPGMKSENSGLDLAFIDTVRMHRSSIEFDPQRRNH